LGRRKRLHKILCGVAAPFQLSKFRIFNLLTLL
jgi:hypothetical protein